MHHTTSLRLYNHLTKLYPADHHQEYALAMQSTFADMLFEDGTLKAWLVILIDLPISLWREYMHPLSRKDMSLKLNLHTVSTTTLIMLCLTVIAIVDQLTYQVSTVYFRHTSSTNLSVIPDMPFTWHITQNIYITWNEMLMTAMYIILGCFISWTNKSFKNLLILLAFPIVMGELNNLLTHVFFPYLAADAYVNKDVIPPFVYLFNSSTITTLLGFGLGYAIQRLQHKSVSSIQEVSNA